MRSLKAAVFAAVVALTTALSACSSTAPNLPADDAAAFQMLTDGNGQEFLRQISTHDWDDGGGDAASRLMWIARDATSADPAAAQRAGEAASVLATFLADNKDELRALPTGWFGLQHRTIGELNPELISGYAAALTPFQGALVGDKEGVQSFETIGDPLNPSAARNIFAIIDTSTQAGTEFNDAAYQRVHGYLQKYGQAIARGNTNGLSALRFAARLAGAVDGGQRESGNSQVHTYTSQHHINWAGYEIARAMGARPGGKDIADSFFTQDRQLKSPDDVSPNELSTFSTALQNFAFSHGLPNLGADFQNWYDASAGK